MTNIPDDFGQYPEPPAAGHVESLDIFLAQFPDLGLMQRILDFEDPEGEPRLPEGFRYLTAADWYEIHLNRLEDDR